MKATVSVGRMPVSCVMKVERTSPPPVTFQPLGAGCAPAGPKRTVLLSISERSIVGSSFFSFNLELAFLLRSSGLHEAKEPGLDTDVLAIADFHGHDVVVPSGDSLFSVLYDSPRNREPAT